MTLIIPEEPQMRHLASLLCCILLHGLHEELEGALEGSRAKAEKAYVLALAEKLARMDKSSNFI
jgi:hypothetical protein